MCFTDSVSVQDLDYYRALLSGLICWMDWIRTRGVDNNRGLSQCWIAAWEML